MQAQELKSLELLLADKINEILCRTEPDATSSQKADGSLQKQDDLVDICMFTLNNLDNSFKSLARKFARNRTPELIREYIQRLNVNSEVSEQLYKTASRTSAVQIVETMEKTEASKYDLHAGLVRSNYDTLVRVANRRELINMVLGCSGLLDFKEQIETAIDSYNPKKLRELYAQGFKNTDVAIFIETRNFEALSCLKETCLKYSVEQFFMQFTGKDDRIDLDAMRKFLRKNKSEKNYGEIGRALFYGDCLDSLTAYGIKV